MSSKRVRFTGESSETNQDVEDDFEFDHENVLESAKKRRGAVKLEGYASDETDTSDDDGTDRFKRRKGNIKEKTTENNLDDMDDMFAEDEPVSKQKEVYDTDKKKIRYLDSDEIVGQDYSSKDTFDDESGEPMIEAFNMKAELEEGKFDEAGNYIRNKKDPEAFHDNWLQGISRKDIEKARIAHEKQEQERKLKEAQEASNVPMDRISIWKELLTIMKRGEKLLDTFQRLGGGAGAKSKNKRASRQYSKKPKGKSMEVSESSQPPEQKELSAEEIEQQQRKKSIERLTDLSDKMMALGHFSVYEDTWEQILENLKKEGAVSDSVEYDQM
ncbi:CD2 antigen cytoplasmic tail-binding protein 2 [Gigaspora margarita]|uniref:CD2 antigen cytoplasmic tail-binding protein 2 n=1 Tax=Gigaspora margarita TaxID=4874 RepID=A0A8H4AKT4_GIGMA|nr:CD2 antigen cytoplasmic tail-binding protein 2 [Gigaspora margarita]